MLTPNWHFESEFTHGCAVCRANQILFSYITHSFAAVSKRNCDVQQDGTESITLCVCVCVVCRRRRSLLSFSPSMRPCLSWWRWRSRFWRTTELCFRYSVSVAGFPIIPCMVSSAQKHERTEEILLLEQISISCCIWRLHCLHFKKKNSTVRVYSVRLHSKCLACFVFHCRSLYAGWKMRRSL